LHSSKQFTNFTEHLTRRT